jgi:hypothetical protein
VTSNVITGVDTDTAVAFKAFEAFFHTTPLAPVGIFSGLNASGTKPGKPSVSEAAVDSSLRAS